MRVRDHVVLSTVGAALLYPWLHRRVIVPWAASILIDVDHYLWFCVHERSLSPREAVRFFDRAQPPQHAGTRLLHSPVLLLVLLVLSARWRAVGLLVLGLLFHASLDRYHDARSVAARRAVLVRDHATCQHCGAQGPEVVAHLWRQPRTLPSYALDNYVSLCAACHEAAHARCRSSAPTGAFGGHSASGV